MDRSIILNCLSIELHVFMDRNATKTADVHSSTTNVAIRY